VVQDIQTAALVFGGNIPPAVGNTESWNGTAWTELNDLNTARSDLGGAGIQTAALAVGGNPLTANTEIWNGTSWTEVNNLNTARTGLIAAGTNTDALAFGGSLPGATGATEYWDGSSWTELNDLSTGRANLGGLGSTQQHRLLVVLLYLITEEWTAATVNSTLTAS
jgi:hypothetical protein